MSDLSHDPKRKQSAEFVAIVAIGVTVLLAVVSQAAWLDGKIERLGVELRAEIRELRGDLGGKIEALQAGQASLDRRLAVVESHVLGVPSVAQPEVGADPAS